MKKCNWVLAVCMALSFHLFAADLAIDAELNHNVNGHEKTDNPAGFIKFDNAVAADGMTHNVQMKINSSKIISAAEAISRDKENMKWSTRQE